MAMAIHSSKLLCETIIDFANTQSRNLNNLFNEYDEKWSKMFRKRLNFGRKVQSLFGSNLTSEFAVFLMNNSGYITKRIIKNTHGEVIKV
jgi:arsenate reductase-like glutaredoxin family protein